MKNNKKKYLENIKKVMNIDNGVIFIPNYEHKKPLDFVYDYMNSMNISAEVLKKSGLDRRYKYRINKLERIKKMDVFRLIFILNMPIQVAKEFLTICGYSFSPINNTDLFFLDYLNGKYKKVNTLKELKNLSKEYCNENFEWAKWM